MKQKEDSNSPNRKVDHIRLTKMAQSNKIECDRRFYYEPIFSAFPSFENKSPIVFNEKRLKKPIWISSMTGGTALALKINQNLAKAAKQFGLGMGLGSCRSILHSNDRFEDFNMRPIIGSDLPLFANLGIAQVEDCLRNNDSKSIIELVNKLDADGLIIHVNPLQEWLQQEGDHFQKSPLDTISKLIDLVDFPLIVKEVGQGFGPKSIHTLLQLPLLAIEFAAFGGTNFSKLETLRNKSKSAKSKFQNIGHSAEEMIQFVNESVKQLGEKVRCKQLIISGGVKDYLDGYYYMNKVKLPAIYGQASTLLEPAQSSFQELIVYLQEQVEGLAFAEAYLNVR